MISEGAINPKILVIILLALVALFVFGTTLSVRGTSFELVKAALNSQSLRSWIDTRLAQPVKAEEIRLSEGEQVAGCAWDGDLMSVPPGATCHYTIHLSKPHWWQLNSTKRLKLRLISVGCDLNVTLERIKSDGEGEMPQVATLQSPAGGSMATLTSPGTQTPALPTSTPTPVQLAVYDPNKQGEDWQLTLENLMLDSEEICQVEPVP